LQNNTVVTYTVRPEARAEHVRLIERIFAQLQTEQPGNVDYQVVCLADGVSFVHVSNHDTADGASPLPALSAFKEFTSDLAQRVATPPTASDATTIGTYRGRVDVPADAEDLV
jgi:hypothetical protein